MIMIMTLQGAIRFCYNVLTALRTISYTYAQVATAQSCANHVERRELITCNMSYASRYEGIAELLDFTELKSRFFQFYFVAKTKNG